MEIEKQIFCGKCGVQNPILNNFCFKCGNKINEPVQPLSVEKKLAEKKVAIKKIITPNTVYTELNKYLVKLIKTSGHFNLKIDIYNIEFLKASDNSTIYIVLGLMKYYSAEQRKILLNNSYEVVDFKFNKSIVLTDINTSIEEIILEAKNLFENILQINNINEFQFSGNFPESAKKNIAKKESAKISGKAIFFLIVIGMALIGYCTQSPEERAADREKKEIESKFDSWDGSHIKLVQYVKPRLRDPNSFGHVETTYIDKGDKVFVTMQFRCKNGFGGVNNCYAYANCDKDTGEVLSCEIMDE